MKRTYEEISKEMEKAEKAHDWDKLTKLIQERISVEYSPSVMYDAVLLWSNAQRRAMQYEVVDNHEAIVWHEAFLLPIAIAYFFKIFPQGPLTCKCESCQDKPVIFDGRDELTVESLSNLRHYIWMTAIPYEAGIMANNFVIWCLKHIDALKVVDYDFSGFRAWEAGEIAISLVNKGDK